ncbi:MAG TPA: carboxypeptidase-like regulatory domain-containing protein, partial [Acidobacteriaceae bacterium]|nr:carboxypeptidase-like regulatory domain-containing protein [Acidobacteriaceae bacterium]
MMQVNPRPPALRRLVLGLAMAVGLFFLPHAFGQLAGTGTIQGTVTDPSGAVVPGAQVTVTSEATGVKHQTVSSGGGLFSFPNLPVGTYNMAVTATGFKTYSRT